MLRTHFQRLVATRHNGAGGLSSDRLTLLNRKDNLFTITGKVSATDSRVEYFTKYQCNLHQQICVDVFMIYEYNLQCSPLPQIMFVFWHFNAVAKVQDLATVSYWYNQSNYCLSWHRDMIYYWSWNSHFCFTITCKTCFVKGCGYFATTKNSDAFWGWFYDYAQFLQTTGSIDTTQGAII